MKSSILIVFSILFLVCHGCGQASVQNQKGKNKYEHIGGPCEGCEAIYECPESFENLKNMAWLPDWNDKGQKLAINGTVYKKDGPPAAGVVIYVYHTDQAGVYPKKGDEKGWAKRHGYIRGWMKTNEKGEYKFFTLKPAPYPGGNNPAHIHITIKEPDKNEYWIDEYLFDDDPLVTENMKTKNRKRGGDGIIKVKDVGNMLKAERNIYLGMNVTDYPN